MRKLLRIIFTIIALGTVVFLFRTELTQIFLGLQNKYLPCNQPITYSIGSFDERFNISKEEFLRVVSIAEETWEKSIDKQLFTYVLNGDSDLKINLIYDIRQEASQKLKDIGITVSDTKASYNDLKSRYSAMQIDYLRIKTEFESRVVLFQNRQNAYEKEVTYLNKTGGASKDEYDRLNKEKNSLDGEFKEINKLQSELNTKVENINALVVVLNRLVSSLNIEVKKFNTIGSELGGEFEEGTYKEDPTGREIDIYQFDNKGKLARVLTHEFGHALELEHLENSKAVMYRLNNGVNEKLTIDDILALKKRCNLLAQ
ncbi:MAG: Matrixin superfamily protein [Candidatus Nomurabacteria bacterium GW2011_GWB1_35_20]|uniref:Matrixin superfamily protein n=2 Tax=Candidatus Nomuraibacteriota TaxID=1752729 RepID=A0A0G0H0Z6_9BACT|nr:MAG: Matrixin superfamily protein [Candidatus Nomurabacteria bacterium GW2011_GWB1_35_20]KKP76385.1 MAG: hypothetical protein UR72_C0002G0031 [Parcubacteria group bacterium GW2011_GWC1_35_21]KKP85499.1 MAG: Matrixin superfamily protein [Parcubacteria group bacterium GW2011_GWD2_35_7]KKP97597.1 MAG: Matrixin superfamily protein [Candidatus Nomurabacteria bacterium GW2011_GWA1_36_15]